MTPRRDIPAWRVAARRFAAAGLLAAGLFALSGAASGPASALTVAPHRAIYDLALGTTRGDSTVSQARGRIEFEWDDVCDGWSVRQKTLLVLVNRSGREIRSNWIINSWESKDGLRYRFFVRRFRPDGMVEQVSGSARLDGPGLGGEAIISEPQERRLKLPKGTIFPTDYSLHMIALAEGQGLPAWRVMFDGFGDEALQGVNAALVGSVAPGEPASVESDLIADLRSWRVRLAFFPLGQETALPEREQGFRVFANGVVDELVIDYGDFSIDASLEDLSPLPEPSC